MIIKDDKEFIDYCLSVYNNQYFEYNEFIEELNQVVTLKRIFRRYIKTNKINERLVLNIIITLLNMFNIEAVNIIIFYKLPKEFHSLILPFLIHLNSYKINNVTNDIKADSNITRLLQSMV